MPHTYYIIDEDGEVSKTHDRTLAIQAAHENEMCTVISPHENECWIGTDRQQIEAYKPPEDDGLDPDDPDGEGDDE